MKKKIIIIIILLFLLGILNSSYFILNTNEYVIITQLGKYIKTIETPGIYFKMPLGLQTVIRFDNRLNIYRTVPIQLLLKDQNPIITTLYICWKINDPLLFYQAIGTLSSANYKINDMVISELGNVLSNYKIDDIINSNIKTNKINEIENTLFKSIYKLVSFKYGIKIMDLGIRRLNYPSLVAETVYNRMQSEREKESQKYRAEGRKKASEIEAETDKKVSEILANAAEKSEIIKGSGDSIAMQIYVNVYKKDADFFEFIKSLESYKQVLTNKTQLILSTDNDLFKYLNYKSGK